MTSKALHNYALRHSTMCRAQGSVVGKSLSEKSGTVLVKNRETDDSPVVGEGSAEPTSTGLVPVASREALPPLPSLGGHYCPEWDFMWIEPKDPEWEACICGKA